MADKVFYFEHKEEVSFLWKTTITSIDAKVPANNLCSKCKSLLTKDSMVIKGDSRGYYRLHGLLCNKCRTLYVPSKILDDFSEVCQDNFPKEIKHYTSTIQRERNKFFKSVLTDKQNNVVCI